MTKPKNANDSGFILIAVLWGTVTLATIALLIGQTVRSQISSAEQQFSQLRRSLIAESTFNRVLFAFTAAGDPFAQKLISDGRPLLWDFNGSTARINIEAESGKLDLNMAELKVISHVLKMVIGDQTGQRLTETIEQGRDHGRIFQSLNVIDQATLPIGSAQRLKSVFTVNSRMQTIDPMTASPILLAALPGSDNELVKQILKHRQKGALPQAAKNLSQPFGRSLKIELIRIAIKEGTQFIPSLELILDRRFGTMRPLIVEWNQFH